MIKQHILDEIRRTAQANGGVPLGRDRFSQETGIKEFDWFGKYWARWGDALREAGFAPNKLQGAYSEDEVFQRLIGLIRELGRFPVLGDLRLKRRTDPTFPSHNVFNRLGPKDQIVSRVLEYCRNHSGHEDVVALCPIPSAAEVSPRAMNADAEEVGFVYLLRSGRFYKVGKTNAFGRRERELAIQLPEKARTVHVMKTDDPAGIEAYWQTRFSAKRRHGEWFELDSSDVKAFRRRKFM